jgi:hypothetical protein
MNDVLARPLIPPAKVLGVSRHEGGLTEAGLRGRRPTFPTVAESPQVFGRFRASGFHTRPGSGRNSSNPFYPS